MGGDSTTSVAADSPGGVADEACGAVGEPVLQPIVIKASQTTRKKSLLYLIEPFRDDI
jgi:hypothetical protein